MQLLKPIPLEAIDLALAERSLKHFMQQAWHVVEPNTNLVWGRHLDAMVMHLEAVSRGAIQNLVITIPPGATKSLTCSVFWPAWTWIKRPWIRWLTASNDSDLVLRDAVSCRDLINSDWYQDRWSGVYHLAFDQNVKGWYKNDKKGFRTAVSVGSKVTGKKGDILLVDDPDDAVKVRSQTERGNVHSWYDRAFYNRVNNHKTGRRVIIGQRLDPDDLIGHILRTGEYVHLNLPEEFNPRNRCVTVLGWQDWRTEPGELLRPDMFGPEEAKTAKLRLRTDYEAVHNQNPVKTEGVQFKREWLRLYSRRGSHYVVGDKLVLDSELRGHFLTVDCAATVKKLDKDDPDYTVISAWATTPDNMLIWLGCLRLRCEIPDIPSHVAGMYARYGARKAYIEGGGLQKGVGQLSRRHPSGMNVIEFVPQGDKLRNATDALCMAEAGRVWMPADDPAFPLEEVQAELLRFTGSGKEHDDIVDTLASAARFVMGAEPQRKTIKMGGVIARGLIA